MSGARNLEGLKMQVLTCIEVAYDKGYKAAKQDVVATGNKSEYERGLSDAEKAIKRVVDDTSKGGLYASEMQEIFETTSIVAIFSNHSITEIIEKIREYDERKQQEELKKACDDEIHIGDEVMLMNQKYIVVKLMKYEDDAIIINQKDVLSVPKNDLKKTGRNYPVAEMLEGLK